jgi:nucleolar pre-ribosomal-associated protein 1
MFGTASSPHSYLYILLRAYNTTDILATRLAITSLLEVILSDSILFQEDAEEVYLWLDSLPTTRRAPGAEAPDGAMLTDESSSVLEFLDDCVQRCLKTPYRYLEEKDALVRSVLQNVTVDERMAISDHQELLCSPVLITMLDQLGAKMASNLLTPSDVLAITTFIRKLVFSLSSKQHSLVSLTAFVDKVDLLVHPGLFPQYPNITTAIRGEISILRFSLRHMQTISAPQPPNNYSVAQDFLNQIDQVPIRQCPFSVFVEYLSNTFHTSCICKCTCNFSI